MNFLQEVLIAQEEVNLSVIQKEMPEFESKVVTCKKELLTYIENIYVKHTERPKQNRELAKKLDLYKGKLDDIMGAVGVLRQREIPNWEQHIKTSVENLENLNVTVKLMDNVLRIHNFLVEIRGLKQKGQYLSCIEKIKEVKAFIQGIPEKEKLQAVDELEFSVIEVDCELIHILNNLFKDHVDVKSGPDDVATIKISQNLESLNKVLPALYSYSTSINCLDKITKFLWLTVFVPTIDHVTEISEASEGNFKILEIKVKDPKNRASYQEVFENIKKITGFLQENFNIIISESNSLTALNYIGQDLRDNLSELIIKHCLQYTIPSTAEGLKDYNIVIGATQDLEGSLKQAGIFASDQTPILDYANSIDVLFINKKCQNYLVKANTFMKKDLHDMVEVGVVLDNTSFEESVTEFPRSSVSKGAIDLVNLAESMLEEAVNGSEMSAGRLICTVEKIINTYGVFVTEHHKKLLETIPQQVALFYNNCRYICFNVSRWHEEYLIKLAPTLNLPSNKFAVDCLQLDEMSCAVFHNYVEGQIKQIGEIMKNCDLQQVLTLEQLDPRVDKCLRQCLRQQELLKTVWHKVLPYKLYNTSLGLILNSLCNYFVNTIIKLEDISSEAAEGLVDLLKMITTRGPKLFTDPNEVTLFVECWYKVNELIFILNANLSNINDRWSDGKGPLGLQFTSSELRNLIRALFQNTERRAALLAKITD